MRGLPVAVLLLAALLLPCCWAYRDGARNESCYNHRITHEEGDPDPIPCGEDCAFSLDLIGEYDYLNMKLIDENVTMLQCGKVYQLSFSTENLAGYLVQARKGGTAFEPTSNIVGTWMNDLSDPPMYRILQCGRNSSSQSPVFNNSVTQTDLVEETSISFYWKAPICLRSDTFNVTFFFSVMPNIHTAFEPVPFGPWTVECSFPEYEILEGTNSPTVSPTEQTELQPEQSIGDMKYNKTSDDMPPEKINGDITEVSDDGSGDVGGSPTIGPSPPRNFTLTMVPGSSTTLNATWARPSITPSNIISYEIICNDSEGSVVHQFSGAVTTAILTNLKPYTLYFCYMRAQNGERSFATYTLMARTDIDVPSAPRNFELIAPKGSSNLLMATWMPPDPSNGIIHSYRVYCVQNTTNYTIPGTDNLAVLYLAPDREYNCSVLAFTEAGPGNASLPMLARTGQFLPGEVRNLTAITSPQSITVTWQPPRITQGIITRFELSLLNNIEWIHYNLTATNLTFTATNLLPYTNHTFQVAAVSRAGRGPSTRLTVYTDEDAPSHPILCCYNATNNSIKIEWTPPQHPNGIIRYYRIRYSQSSPTRSTNITYINTHDAFTFYNITGLRPDTNYTFRVAAFTVTLGPYSFSLNARTFPGIPTAPRNVTAISKNHSTILVSWTAPAFPTKDIREFVITYFPMANVSDVRRSVIQSCCATSFRILNLKAYTNYTISVAAFTFALGETSTVIARTQESVPANPRNFMLTLLHGYPITISASWMTPNPTNGIISGYTISCSSPAGSLQHYSNGSATNTILSNLRGSTSYTCTVIATTSAGNGDPSEPQTVSTPPDRPAPPRRLLLIANPNQTVSQTLTAEWIVSVFSDRPIDSYMVTCNDIWTFNIESNEILISTTLNLSRDTEYTCIVQAHSEVGYSLPSEAAVGRTGQFLPGEPRNLSAVINGPQSVTFTWLPPRVTQGLINQYLIHIISGSEERSYHIQGTGIDTFYRYNLPSIEHTIRLDPFTNHTFDVAAYVTLGSGPNASIAVSTGEDAPSRPVLDYVNTTAHSMHLKWSAPSQLNGIIRHYRISYYATDDTSNVTEIDTENVTLDFTIYGLRAFTHYAVRVAGFTVALGEYSDSITELTKKDRPSAPQNVTAVIEEPSVVLVTWRLPLMVNGLIINYIVEYSSTLTPANITTVDTFSTALEYRITGLSPFTNYSIRVIAVNDFLEGESSPASPPIIVRLPEDVPSAPTHFRLQTISQSSSTLSASWDRPQFPNGIITGYTVTCNSSSGSSHHYLFRGSMTDAIITNLTQDMEYTCAVFARTSAGDGITSELQTARTAVNRTSAPRRFLLEAVNQTLYASWIEPEFIYGTIRLYSIVCIHSTLVFSSQTTELLLHGLQYDREYTCEVSAVNEAGRGATVQATARTGQFTPSRPEQLTGEVLSPRAIRVTWLIPRIPQGIIAYYSINITSSYRDNETSNISSNLLYNVSGHRENDGYTFNIPYTALSLNVTPYSTHRVYVSARGSLGYGPSSNITLRTNEAASSPPILRNKTSTSTSIDISWNLPALPNGRIRYYQVSYYPRSNPSIINQLETDSNVTFLHIQDLHPYTYYQYRVAAFTIELGEYLEGSIRTKEGAASAPLNVRVSTYIPNSSYGLIEVTWDRPQSENGIIRNYLVRVFETFNPETSRTLAHHKSRNRFILSDLLPYTNYTVSVAAYTLVIGEFSPFVTIVTNENRASSPRNFRLSNVPGSPSMLSASWVEPERPRGILSGYTVYCTASSLGITTFNFSSSVTNATLSNLHGFTRYRCYVQAVNGAGPGNRSEPLNATTSAGVPSAPRDFFVVASIGTEDQLTAVWRKPEFSNGVIDGYRIVCNGSSSLVSNDINTYTHNNSYLYSEAFTLLPDTEYSCILQAHTEVGYGPPSAPGLARTGQHLPGPLRHFHAISRTSTTFEVFWEPPRITQGPILRYELNITNVYVNDSRVEYNFTDSPVMIQGVMPHSVYLIEMRAVSLYGNGPISGAAYRTHTDAPSAPHSLNATTTNSSITLTWQPPETPNGVIRFYRISYYPQRDPRHPIVITTESSSPQRITITGLRPWFDYSLKVAAITNEMGPFSDSYFARTKDSIPEAPFGLSAITGPTSITLSWFAPRLTPVRIVRHELSVISKSGRNNYIIYGSSQSRSHAYHFTATHLTPFTNYTFEVAIVKLSGRGPSARLVARTDEGAPGKPLSLNFPNKTSTSLFMTWAAPVVTNGIVRYYQIEHYWIHKSHIVEQTKVIVAALPRSFNITGLRGSTNYHVKVAAFTVVLGNYSDTEILPTFSGVPSAPLHLNVIGRSSTTIQIQWQQPEYPNGLLRHYILSYYPVDYPSDVTEIDNIPPNNLTYTMRRLTPYTNYSITLTGVTISPGLPSRPLIAMTSEDAPSPPILYALEATATTLHLRWVAPATLNGMLQFYQILYFVSNNVSSTMEVRVPPSQTSYTIENVRPSNNYSVSVAASTSVLGEYGNTLTAFTELLIPGAPVIQFTNATTTTIFLMWSAPEKSSGSVEYYLVRYGHNRNLTEHTAARTAELHYTITGLLPAHTYRIQVAAVALVTGHFSDIVSVETSESTPGAVTDLAISIVSNTSLRVVFYPPRFSNGVILRYNLYYVETVRHAPIANETTLIISANEATFTNNGLLYTILLSNLEVYTLYRIRVAGFTSVGKGVIDEIFASPGSANPPRNVTIVNITSFAVTITWEPPDILRGGRISEYFIRHYYNHSVDNYGSNSDHISGLQNIYTIHGLRHNTHYTIRVGASTVVMDAVSPLHGLESTPVTVWTGFFAGPPSDLTAVAGATTISVTWLPPIFVNGEIVWYQLSFIEGGQITTLTVHSTFNNSYTFTKLKAFTNYTIRVRPVGFQSGDHGQGDQAVVTVVTKETVPVSPVLIDAHANATTLYLSWYAPTLPRGIVRHYYIQYSEGHEFRRHTEIIVGGSQLDYTITGLTPATVYSVRVAAFTITLGPYSNHSTVTTLEDLPGPVSNLRFEFINITELAYSFSTPRNPNGVITSYNIRCVPRAFGRTYHDYNRSFVIRPNESGDYHGNISFLYSGTYRCRVAAVTAIGEGEVEQRFVSTDILNLNVLPRNVRATAVTANSITVLWDPPMMGIENPRWFRGYVIRYYSTNNLDDERELNISDRDPLQLKSRISGLTSNTTYKITVRLWYSRNGYPYGQDDTEPITVRTGIPPREPSNLTGEAAVRSILLTWQPPLQPNGRIIRYELRIMLGKSQWRQYNISSSVLRFAVANLFPNTYYTIQVAAVNTFSRGPYAAVTVLTKAEAPPTPIVTSIQTTATTIFFEWHLMKELRKPIQYFVVEYSIHSPPNAIPTEILVPSSHRSYIIAGLIPATRYYVRVAAFGLILGEYSPWYERFTQESRSSPPTYVRAISTASDTIMVTWQPPAMPNGVIEGYRVYRYENNGNSFFHESTTNSTFLYYLRHLQTFTNYSIAVLAYRTGTLGRLSLFINVTTLGGIPGAPIIYFTNTTATKIHLMWSAPTRPNASIASYLVRYRLVFETHNTWEYAVSQSSQLQYIITGLIPVREYQIQVAAVALLTGRFSNAVNVQTSESTPNAVTNLTIFIRSDTSLTVVFYPPHVSTGVILGYNLYYVETRQLRPIFSEETLNILASQAKSTKNGLQYTIILHSLKDFITYRIRVTGYTSVGEGVEIRKFASTRSPSPPRNVTVVNVTSSSITIAWEPPDNLRGGRISGYFIRYFLNHSVDTVRGFTVNPSNLQSSLTSQHQMTHYTITVGVYIQINEHNRIPGLESTPVTAWTEKFAGPPSNVTAIASATSFTVTWQPPVFINGQISSYTVAITEGSHRRHFNVRPTTYNSYTAYSLKAFTNYTIEIWAISTALSHKDFSTGDIATVTVLTKEAAPLSPILQDSYANTTTLYLSWYAPTPPRGIVRHYYIQYTEGLQFTMPTEIIVGGSQLNYTISGLTPATVYSVRVAAFTVALGPYSNHSSVTTMESLPGPVSNLRFEVLNSSALAYSFSAPKNPNSVITSYNIRLVPKQHGTIDQQHRLSHVIRPNESGNYRGTISDLLNTTYRVRVAAITAIGEGEVEQRFVFMQRYEADYVPKNLRPTAVTTTTIRLAWDTPKKRVEFFSGHVIRYYSTNNLDDDVEVVLSRGIPPFQTIISFLTPNTTYKFTVRVWRLRNRTMRYLYGLEESEPITVKTGVLPREPRNLTAEAAARFVHLTWQPPLLPGGRIIRYELEVIYKVSQRRQYNISSNTLMFTVTDLSPDTSYIFQVAAVNGLGRGANAAVTVLTMTEALPAPFVTSIQTTTTTIYFAWNVVGETREPIRHFIVQYSRNPPPNAIPMEIPVGTSQQFYTISGLRPLTRYYLRVAAVGLEVGEYSPWQERFTQAIRSSPPTRVRAISPASDSIVVTWLPPERPNGVIEGYTVYYGRAGEIFQYSTSNSTFLYRIQHLQAFTNYSVAVLAYRKGALGEFSSYVNVTTLEGIPGTPIITFTNATATTMFLMWSALERPNANITSYQVRYGLENVTHMKWKDSVSRTSQLHYNITGLMPAQHYQVQVAAVASLTGQFSDAVSVQTSEGTPDAVTNLTILVRSSTSLRVIFYPPNPSNGVILGYNLYYSESQSLYYSVNEVTLPISRSNAVLTKSGLQYSVILYNLKGNIVYHIRVAAFTSAGEGIFAQRFATTRSVGPPRNVAIINVTSFSISITWEPPDNLQGSRVSSYRVLFYRRVRTLGSHIIGASRRQLTIVGLSHDSLYTITVAAITQPGNIPGLESTSVTAMTGKFSGPPSNVTIITTTTTVTVTWQLPIIIFEEVHYFQIALVKGTQYYRSYVDLNKNNFYTHTFTNLKAFTTYFVFISPLRDLKGQRDHVGDSFEMTIRTKEAAPGSPIFHDVHADTTTIYLAWYAPTTPRGIIRHYYIQYSKGPVGSVLASFTTIIVGGSQLHYAISGLIPTTQYHVRVAAFTVALGNYTDDFPVTTLQPISGPVSDLRIRVVSHSKLEYSFSTPMNPGGDIFFYIIRYALWNNMVVTSDRQTITDLSGNYSGVIEQLDAHSTYRIQVSAYTAGGEGQVEQRFTSMHPTVANHPPRNVRATAVSGNSITVSWNIDRLPVANLMGYIIRYYPTNDLDDAREVRYLRMSPLRSSISGLTSNTSYKITVRYRIALPRRHFLFADGDESEPITVRTSALPGEPMNLNAEATARSVNLTWQPPLRPGGRIIRYELSIMITGLPQKRQYNISSTALMFTATDLSPDTNYTFQVAAVNVVGRGPSAAVTVLVLVTAPPAPFITTIRTTTTTILLVWDFLLKQPREVIRYFSVQYSIRPPPNGIPIEILVASSKRSYTITGLMPVTRYFVRVAAFGDVQLGEYSPWYGRYTQEGIPSAPRNFSLSTITGNPRGLRAMWIIPDPSNGEITGYAVICNNSQHGYSESTKYQVAMTVTDLQPYTIYRCSVYAITAVGAGNYSASDVARTDEGLPSAPRDFVLSSSGTTIFASWSEPEFANGIIYIYAINCTIPSQDNPFQKKTTAFYFPSSNTDASFSNLRPLTNYTCSISATTGGGIGNFSASITVQTGEASRTEVLRDVTANLSSAFENKVSVTIIVANFVLAKTLFLTF